MTTHRHKDSRGQWTTSVTDPDLSVYAKASDLAALAARVAALESPVVTPPVVTPPLNSKPAKSIADIKALLLDDTVDEIVVANGTYRVSSAHLQAADSLWIGGAYAGRTRPVVVRAALPGAVTLDGGGATTFIAAAFMDRAHDQTWVGINCANGRPQQTGVILFGGAGSSGGIYDVPPAHHITLDRWAILGSCTSPSTGANDHAVYFSQAKGDGPHHISLIGLSVDGSGGLDTAIHAFHSAPGYPNAHDVLIDGMTVNGTDQAVILWDATLRDWTIQNSTITGATNYAIRYEGPADGPILLRGVLSTGSRNRGFYSSLGSNPPGVTFDNCSLA